MKRKTIVEIRKEYKNITTRKSFLDSRLYVGALMMFDRIIALEKKLAILEKKAKK